MPRSTKNRNTNGNHNPYSRGPGQMLPICSGIYFNLLDPNYVLTSLKVIENEQFIIIEHFGLKLRMPTLNEIYNIDVQNKTRSPNGFILFRKMISNHYSLREEAYSITKKFKSVGTVSTHTRLMWKHSTKQLQEAFKNLAKQYQKMFSHDVVVYKEYTYTANIENKKSKSNSFVAVDDVDVVDAGNEFGAGAIEIEENSDIEQEYDAKTLQSAHHTDQTTFQTPHCHDDDFNNMLSYNNICMSFSGHQFGDNSTSLPYGMQSHSQNSTFPLNTNFNNRNDHATLGPNIPGSYHSNTATSYIDIINNGSVASQLNQAEIRNSNFTFNIDYDDNSNGYEISQLESHSLNSASSFMFDRNDYLATKTGDVEGYVSDTTTPHMYINNNKHSGEDYCKSPSSYSSNLDSNDYVTSEQNGLERYFITQDMNISNNNRDEDYCKSPSSYGSSFNSNDYSTSQPNEREPYSSNTTTQNVNINNNNHSGKSYCKSYESDFLLTPPDLPYYNNTGENQWANGFKKQEL